MNEEDVRREMLLNMDIDLEEDISAELEDFILLARLGVVEEAQDLIQNVLRRHVDHFPVFAEVAGFCVEQQQLQPLRLLLDEVQSRDVHFPIQEETDFLSAVMLFINPESSQHIVAWTYRMISALSDLHESHVDEQPAASQGHSRLSATKVQHLIRAGIPLTNR